MQPGPVKLAQAISNGRKPSLFKLSSNIYDHEVELVNGAYESLKYTDFGEAEGLFSIYIPPYPKASFQSFSLVLRAIKNRRDFPMGVRKSSKYQLQRKRFRYVRFELHVHFYENLAIWAR